MGLPGIPEVRIQLGLSGATIDPSYWQIGDPVRGVIGTAAIGPDDVWVDITADVDRVRSWSFRRGTSRGDGAGPIQYDAGTATVVVNNGDRAFDPTNLSGPYVSGGETQLTPMVRMQITAVWDGIGYPLWYGFVDRFLPDYDDPTWSYTTITASDAFKVFGSYDRQASAPVGSNEGSGARIGRILTSIGWPTDDRDISTGDSLLQATTLDGNALSEMQQVAASEMGDFYAGRDGKAVFRNRHALLEMPRSTTSQATFGDAGMAAGEVPYATAPVDYSDDTMANLITATRIGGAVQSATDATSIARFLTKTYSPSGELWLTTDAETLSWAQAVLYQAKDPELRFQQIRLNVPAVADEAIVWPIVLDREFADRVTVIRRPPGGGVNERDVFIRGIEMQSNGEDWKTTFTFQSAARYSFWTIGDPILGAIGSNAIAF